MFTDRLDQTMVLKLEIFCLCLLGRFLYMMASFFLPVFWPLHGEEHCTSVLFMFRCSSLTVIYIEQSTFRCKLYKKM